MLFIMLTSNISFSSVSLWERAINRGFLVGNVVLAFLSFHWVYSKKVKFQKIVKETKITNRINKSCSGPDIPDDSDSTECTADDC